MRSISRAASVCVLLAIGCGGSINSTYKAEVDRHLAGLRSNRTNHPAADGFEPMPLAVGQWIEMKMVDAKRRPGLVTYKIVGQQGTAFWVETATTTYMAKQEMRMLIDFGDRANPETMNVKSFTLRSDGKLQQYPPGMQGLLRSLWKPVVANLVVKWQDAPREQARVAAGDFEGCYKRRLEASVGPYHQISDTWSHPDVPINGMVKSVGVDKPNSMELVAFGTEGASSTF